MQNLIKNMIILFMALSFSEIDSYLNSKSHKLNQNVEGKPGIPYQRPESEFFAASQGTR
jgi:hypothetical protein